MKPTLFYSWFSDLNERPEVNKSCMDSWDKYLSDLPRVNLNKEFINKHSIDSSYLNHMVESEMWAFASDYLRFYAMYNFGGLYLDSDVMVSGVIDDIYNKDYYLTTEGFKSNVPSRIEAAILYWKTPGDHMMKKLLDHYEELPHYELSRSELQYHIAPRMMYDVGFKATSESHQNLCHQFTNTWIDRDVWFKDDIDILPTIKLNSRWHLVDHLTESTIYVITREPENFHGCINLNLKEYTLDNIKIRLT